ncbi:hypothetical protein J6590_006528 [Homalodisca vitripennis]|nr:hypothetical protein J6590_006528 [Homalodisca vitripennis]
MESVGDPTPKKKPKLGRLSDVKKKLLKQSHEVRESYNGTFMTYSMTRKSTKTQKKLMLLEHQKDVIEMKRGLNLLPSPLYNKAIQISKAKSNDLQDLKKFLPREAQLFYEGQTFKYGNNTDDDGDVTVG